MATTRDYWNAMQTIRRTLAELFGTASAQSPKDVRAEHGATLVATAALAKALVDKGVLTDSDVTTALSNAVSADGSFWDPEPPDIPPIISPPAAWSAFPGEDFEGGANGVDATALNTAFAQGQTGSSLLSTDATAQFDSSTHRSGSLSLNVSSHDGNTRSLATEVFESTATLFVRFYFKASVVPPTTRSVRIFAAQNGITPYDDPVFEVGVDSGGEPFMVVDRVGRFDTVPNICDAAWWRVEAGMYVTTLGPVCELRLYTGANLTGTTLSGGFQADAHGTRVSIGLLGHTGSYLPSGQSWSCWFDDAALSDSGWIGP